MIRSAKRLRRDERGTSIVEFALMLVPFCMVLLGLIDLSYQMYLQSVLQGATNDVTRSITVENPNLGTSGALDERIRQTVAGRMAHIDLDGVVYTVTSQSYYRWANHGRPEPLSNDIDGDGTLDPGDCWLDTNPNGTHDASAAASGTGSADDIVQVSVNLRMRRLFPVTSLFGVSNQYDMTVRSATKRQPFREQRRPNVQCRPAS